MISETLRSKLNDRLIVVSVSGGKDSAAASLFLKELGVEHKRVFADTGWEHPATYKYINGELQRILGKIDIVRGELPFVDLIKKRRMFPSRQIRFCTQELKIKPIGRYIKALMDAGEDVVNVVGIRAEESRQRAQLGKWEWQDGWDCEIWRPILHWTLNDVIAIHKRHFLRPNPLYLLGAERVGCWPCVFARKSDIRLLHSTDQQRINDIQDLEQSVGNAVEASLAARGTSLTAEGLHRPTFFATRRPVNGNRFVTIDKAVEHAYSNVEEPFAFQSDGCARWGMCEHVADDSGSNERENDDARNNGANI